MENLHHDLLNQKLVNLDKETISSHQQLAATYKIQLETEFKKKSNQLLTSG